MNALVTGASSGIGKEIALLLAERGYHVVLVARREEELKALAQRCGYGATVLSLDLGLPGAAKRLFDTCQERELPIEVLVNNAGFGRHENHIDTDLEVLESMNHLNVTCLASLCRLFGREMRERGHGSILNVGSTASYLAIPSMANYAASKAFVASLSRALRAELGPFGVQVSLLNPGPTKTGFGARAHEGHDFLASMPGLMTADDVAKAGVDGLFANVGEVLPGAMNQAVPWLVRLVPRSILIRLAYAWAKSSKGSPSGGC